MITIFMRSRRITLSGCKITAFSSRGKTLSRFFVVPLSGANQHYSTMIEIERKFLVVSREYQNSPVRHIRQGYISDAPDRVVRVRIADNRAYLTLKNKRDGFARNEYEYEIPVADAEQMLKGMCRQPILIKDRYLFNYEGHTWEIDEFHGKHEGLVIAEIELESQDDSFVKPAFVGREVTDDPQYYNANIK